MGGVIQLVSKRGCFENKRKTWGKKKIIMDGISSEFP
jgi:hypothetical protein